MKIGYDGKRAVNNMTGLGNYSRLVIEAMARRHPGDDHMIYAPEQLSNPRLDPILHLQNVALRTPPRFWALPKALWRSWGVTADIRRDDVDIYMGLSNELPLNIRHAAVPTVLVMHDVIYRRLPECYTKADRKLYDFKYGHSCLIADRIIAISESTRHDIIEYYGVEEEKIEVIYQGCNSIFRKTAPHSERERLRQLYNLPRRYLIQVGSIEERKNLELSVRALTAIPDDIQLIAVGNGRRYLREMQLLAAELGVASRLKIYSNVPFTDLPGLYQMATASLYPSRYEGFGIPILEALESNTPVIAADTSSLPEAAGDAAILLHPDDVKAMAHAINAIASGSADVQAMTARGKQHAQRFGASNMTETIYACLQKTIRQRQGTKKTDNVKYF